MYLLEADVLTRGRRSAGQFVTVVSCIVIDVQIDLGGIGEPEGKLQILQTELGFIKRQWFLLYIKLQDKCGHNRGLGTDFVPVVA